MKSVFVIIFALTAYWLFTEPADSESTAPVAELEVEMDCESILASCE